MHLYFVRQSRNCKSRRGHRTRLRDCDNIFLYRRNLVLREATHNFKMHISIRTRKIYLTKITSYYKRNIDLLFFKRVRSFFSERSTLRILSCLLYGVGIILIPVKMKKSSLVVDQEFGPKIGLRPIFRPPFLRN